MRFRRPALLLLAAIVLAACGGGEEGTTPSGLPPGTLVIEAAGGEVRVEVEIAETEAARQRGLMGREELAPDAGMVFLEETPSTGGFWMKDTLIPLSVAFWDPARRIVAILDMEPCRADPCEVYYPDAEWVGAVEVNRGFFAEHGVRVGDRVALER